MYGWIDALSICKRSEARVRRAGCKSPPIAGCGFWMNREANTWCHIKACNPSSALAEISVERVKRKKNQAAITSQSAHICVPYLWGLIILPAVDLRALKHLDDGREPETIGAFTTCVCYPAFTVHMCGCFIKDSAFGSCVVLVVTIWKNSSMQSRFDITWSIFMCVNVNSVRQTI